MCILDGNDLTLVNFLALKEIIHKIIKLSLKKCVFVNKSHPAFNYKSKSRRY